MGHLAELIAKNRSYRRFYEERPVSCGTLWELVELARLCPSAGNLQPLKYVLSCERQRNAVIFRYLRWAGYLQDWAGPEPGERPAAYIVMLGDRRISRSFECDAGIAAQSIMLGATERGLGGCMIANVDREGLRRELRIAEHFEIVLVIALGRPKGKVVVEAVGEDGDIRYWRDRQGIHHVPKRALEDLIVD